MTSNKLASARSIFEQNIAKNKQSGCDKNIFGQKAKSPRSGNVSRRLFASTKLSDSCSSNNGNEASLSSLNDSSDDHNGSTMTRRSSSQGGRYLSSREIADVDEQAKGQKTMEFSRSRLSNHHNNSTNYSPPTAISSGTSDLDEKLQPTNTIRIHDAFSLKQAERRRGSVSSLAEHLSKLELKSLTPRGDNSSQASQPSLESHRDQIKLPDFRQSSYTVGTSSSHSLNTRPLATRSRHSPEPAGNDGNQDSISSIGGSDKRQRAKATKKEGSLSPLSSRQESSMSSLDDSSEQHPPKVSPNASSNSGDRKHGSFGSQRPSSMNKSLSQHFSSSSRGNSNSATEWIQPSAIVDDDDSCSSHHHQQPFRAVPFTKSVIKRHRESLKPVGGGRCDSSTSRSSILNSSRSSLISRSSSPGRRPPPRRRSSVTNTSKRRLKEKTAPPPLLDPEEVAMREELEAIQKQIQVSEQKLARIQEGEQHDLKRVQEAKGRKLKRIDAETEKATIASTGSHLPLTQQQEDALKKEYLQAKVTIRQLKQENARLHSQNRTIKLEFLTTKSSNALLEESTIETRVFIAELEAHQQDILLRERTHWMQLATTYQKALLDLEEALERLEPHREKVKSDLIRFEDRIDRVVDFMQKYCKDDDLVEELTEMAFDENEDGWEDEDHESSDDDDDNSRTSFIAPYTASDSEGERRWSVSDVLVGTSSHSLHLFL
jgi:hypothetical protein